MADAAYTVIETPNFIAESKGLLSDAARTELINFLSANPTAGDLIKGSGGARKLRWARTGMGKSSGCRVVFANIGEDVPIFIFTAYAKSKKDNLTDAQVNALHSILSTLADNYKEGVRENV